MVCNLIFFILLLLQPYLLPLPTFNFNSLHIYLTIVLGSGLSRVSLLFIIWPSLLFPFSMQTFFLANLFTIWVRNHSSPVSVTSKSFLISPVLILSDESCYSRQIQYTFISSFIRNGIYYAHASLPLDHGSCIPSTCHNT